MPWNHLDLTAAYDFAEVHGTQELHNEIERMKRLTRGLGPGGSSHFRRGLTVEIFEKHQMLEELLEGESHFKSRRLSRAAKQQIIDTEYMPKARAWKKKHPQVWSEIQGCNC